MKDIQNEIEQNIQGTNSEGKGTGTQVNNLEQKGETNIQSEQNKETRMQKKTRRGLETSGTTLNIPTSESWEYQKEKRNSKILKMYLDK